MDHGVFTNYSKAIVFTVMTMVFTVTVWVFSSEQFLTKTNLSTMCPLPARAQHSNSSEELQQIPTDDDMDIKLYNLSTPAYMSEALRNLQTRSLDALPEDKLMDFIIVTASSRSHFEESIDGVASTQNHFPQHKYKIIYYDIGLTPDQLRQVKTFCNVEVRAFNFTRYPLHVKNLQTYAFKPLIIQEVLQDHQAAVWMDSSVRHQCSHKMYNQTLSEHKSNPGILLASSTGHSNFAVTNPRMYNYLYGDQELLKQMTQLEANYIYMYNTKETFRNVIKPLILCALEADCIAPTGAILKCTFPHGAYKVQSCHRFDQAAINLLLAKWLNYDNEKFHGLGKCVRIARYKTNQFTIKTCPQLNS